MAETILKFVLEKLADAFVKEILHLYGVDKQVEKVATELRWIQAFLKDADKKRIVNEREKQWVKEVRDVAYSIEDVIDTFLSEVPEKMPGKRAAMKRMFWKPKKLPILHNLGNEINQIQARIQEINDNRVAFGITNLGEGVGVEIGGPVKPILLPNVEESGIVGFEADREKIVRLLLDENITRRSVVSIVGAGGLGKTTLAHKAYNSQGVKSQFDLRLWIAISQKFELIDILRKMANQLEIEPPKDDSDHRQLSNLYESLNKKRYLLVLDDVWTKNLWTQIKGVLPGSNNGSRILITTRFLDVAKDADPASEPYKLPFLTKEPSLELLLKKALPNRDVDEGYPDDLYNIGEQLVEKCGGLPLALVALGGLLSKRPANHAAWSKLMQTMHWGTDGRECIAIISSSYDDLPFALKSCFMYLAAFPEDYEIEAPQLLRMWIAEGFIPEEGSKTLEDTAEIFLEDLVQRSMIQVSKRSFAGSIKYCRVHDLLHDLAIQKAKDENFLVVCSKVDDLQNCSQTRRLAIQYQGGSYQEDAKCYGESMKYVASNLRSLLCFNLMPNFSQHRLLKVLHHTDSLDVCENECGMPKSLSQLRYCEFMLGENIEKATFEKFIGSMRFLQTLDLKSSSIDFDIPDCVWYVKTLRHVMLYGCFGPPPSVDLKNLQTLTDVEMRESWETMGLPKLPNLIILKIQATGESQWDTIATLLGTLEHLIFLEIMCYDVPLIDMRGFRFYEHLQTLSLQVFGHHLEKTITFDGDMFPIHLTELKICGLPLREDPMPVLEKLGNLKSLYLSGDCKIQQMCCSAGGFGQLEILGVRYLEDLEEWKIEEGAMPMLKQLEVWYCSRLRVPLGLQYLTVLHELIWTDYEVLDTIKANEIRSICKHVPSIKFI